jgi:hypothetical protein
VLSGKKVVRIPPAWNMGQYAMFGDIFYEVVIYKISNNITRISLK